VTGSCEHGNEPLFSAKDSVLFAQARKMLSYEEIP
jgi:hypothetical protein